MPTDPDNPISWYKQYQLAFVPDDNCWQQCVIVDGAPISSSNPMPVDATFSGDIQIGAVEIKDHNTGTRLDIQELFDNTAALTYDAIEYQKERIHQATDGVMVTSGSTLTVVSYTVPAGKVFDLRRVRVGGNAPGRFIIEVAGQEITYARTSGVRRTEDVAFGDDEVRATASEIVNVKVENVGRTTEEFEASIHGRQVNA